jgi:hypothetical protein
MYKIKLSILLLINIFIVSCTNNQIDHSKQKYSLAYIGGEYDGLLLKNYLESNLKNMGFYQKDSQFEIQASIKHSTNLFITNIDNTSDREKVMTNLYIKIVNIQSECEIYDFNTDLSQFYIYAPSSKFLSNQAALKKIKKDNTESAVRRFINKLNNINTNCNESKKSNTTD